MEFGLYTFGDVGTDPQTGRRIGPSERLRDLVEEIVLADQVGLDVFGLGEHHRPDYAVSAPAVALAAAATRTSRIRLTSAVSVLSSDDPVRVFQQFATLDALTEGRAEIMAGRGSFIESFPLFGYDLDDYDTLFAEKLAALDAAQRRRARHLARRPPHRADRGPRRLSPPVPGAAADLARGRRHAAVGGARRHARAAAGARDHRRRAGALRAAVRPLPAGRRRAGHDPAALGTSINVHGFVAETGRQAGDTFYPAQAEVMNRIGRERGWPPTSRAQFDAARGPNGALFVGSPAEVTDKILAPTRCSASAGS